MGFLKDNKEKRELFNNKAELESKFKEKYKTEKKYNKNKVSQDTKLAISETINNARNLESFNKIDQFSFVNAGIPKDKDGIEIYKRILRVVNCRINTDYADILFEREDTYRGNIFYALDYINDIKEMDKASLDKVFTILAHSNNLTKVETMLDILLYSKNIGDKDTLNNLINTVYFGLYDNLLKVINLLVEYVSLSSKTILNNLLVKLINNRDLNEEQINNLYNLIKVLEVDYNYSSFKYNEELASMLFDTILYVRDKNKLEYINKLLTNYNYLSFSNADRKTKIYDMCVNSFDENIDRNKEILCLVDSVLCMNIEDKVFDYIISKVYELKSTKSISILNTIYPLIDKYSNVDNSIDTINSIEKDGVISKKLVINIDKE